MNSILNDDKINMGKFKNGNYIKVINVEKAVLWRTEELSLRKEVLQECLKRKVKNLIFVDNKTGIGWMFKLKKVVKNMVWKQQGQELQYYFSIWLREKK